MSIKLKPGVLKIKNDNGEYEQISNLFAADTIQLQLDQIEAKGAETLDQIETKGAETLQAIPDDYTELSNQITALKDDLEQAPGLTQEAREALLACFAHVAWIDEHGQDYYDALEEALNSGGGQTEIVISGDRLENYTGWVNTYPYFTQTTNRRIYKELDIPVLGGHIYTIKANTSRNDILMFVNFYNQSVIMKSATQSDITANDHVEAVGGWSTELEHTIVVPKQINGSPTAGVIFGFKRSDDSVMSVEDITSISIKEEKYGTVPSGYTEYDYIEAIINETDHTAIIKTPVYDDVNHVNITMDLLPKSDMATSHVAVFGTRGANDWVTCVAMYVRGNNNAYLVYSHTGSEETYTNAFTKGIVNHVELKQGNATPSLFLNNGNKHEIAWTHNNVINTPLNLFVNVVNGHTGATYLAQKVQIGQFVIEEQGKDPDIYVPVVRNSDNVIGFYNITKKLFITCSDTTKATVGNNNCVYQIGRWG